MTNVIKFPAQVYGPVPVEDVIQGAIDAKMTSIIIIGYDSDGDEYFAASDPDGANANWLLDRMKKRLLEASDKTLELE